MRYRVINVIIHSGRGRMFFFSYFTLTESIAPLRPSKLYDMIAGKTNKVD